MTTANDAFGYFKVRRWGRLWALALVVLALVGTAAWATTVQSSSTVAAAVPTVDASCGAAPADCAAAINTVLGSTSERPLTVTFGIGGPAGRSYRFATSIVAGPGVTIRGVNRPVVKVDTSRLFWLDGGNETSFRNFDVDLNRCADVTAVFYSSVDSMFTNVDITNVNVVNGNADEASPSGCDLISSGAVGASGLLIDNVTADKVRRFLRLRLGSDHRDVTVSNSVATHLGNAGINIDGYAEQVLIENNRFLEHTATAETGHMIGFQPATASSPSIKARNVVIRGNTIQGRRDSAHLRVNGEAESTGAAGDLVAIRGVDGVLVENNFVINGGEAGITLTAGSKNAVIKNNVVGYTDTAGLVIGNVTGGNLPVSNIEVFGNDFFHNGLDRLNEFRPRGWNLPVINIWNARSVCIVNNDIHDNALGLGMWVYNGNSARWPSSVTDLYVKGNILTNNLTGFVQSDHPSGSLATGGYQPAAPTGGTFWTARWPGTDADGDNMPRECTSETNDSNPCVPDLTAPSCTQQSIDTDADGVVDRLDVCPRSTPAHAVDARGCFDGDGDITYRDAALTDPRFDANDSDPCSPDPSGVPTGDCDGDGVQNVFDVCEGTTPGGQVDSAGCTGDTQPTGDDFDGDGFYTTGPGGVGVDPDDLDACNPNATKPACQPAANAGDTITIRARGATGVERMRLAVNGRYMANFDDISTQMTTYTWEAPSSTAVRDVRVHFLGQGTVGDLTKQLDVDWIEVGGTRHQSESPETQSTGSVIDGGDSCLSTGFRETDTLRCNGWFKYFMAPGTVINEATLISTVTVRARGNTGIERMRLTVGGRSVANFNDVSTGFTEYTWTAPAPTASEEIRVSFLNRGRYRGVVKALEIDWIEVDGTRYQSEAPETVSLGSAVDTDSTCLPLGNQQTDTLVCNGYFKYPLP